MNFWAGKKIVVTGGRGFVGKHIVEGLRRRHVERDNIYVPNCDLRVTENVGNLYYEVRPDIVIHLAASCGGLGANLTQPGNFFYDNMKMGIELMEIGRRSKLEKFVQIGTICAYPKVTAVPFHEDDIWLGYPEETNAPYGIAKKALLVMAQAYRQQYGMNAIYVMPTNMYGTGDSFDAEKSHVIPALIEKFEDAKRRKADSVSVWGTGKATRDFLHVSDAVEGILLATELYNDPAPVNLGSGVEVPIAAVASIIRDAVGFEGDIIWDATKLDGQLRRVLDTTRAEKAFGFKATKSLVEGIRETVAWYEAACGK